MYPQPPCKERSALEGFRVSFIRPTVCSSCLSQSTVAKVQELLSSHPQSLALVCSSAWLSFSLASCKDLSATVCMSNTAIKHYPRWLCLWKLCCVVFLCLLNILNCVNSKNVSHRNGGGTGRAPVNKDIRKYVHYSVWLSRLIFKDDFPY